jgi:hypothetical protein
MENKMRDSRVVYTAAAFAAAMVAGSASFAETVNVGVDALTVAATWRAQPTNISEGGSTTFKLSLTATGNAGTTGIQFGQANFGFASGSADSQPVSAVLTLQQSAASAGRALTALLPSLDVTYFKDGVYSATIGTGAAPVSWKQDGIAKSGTYDVDIATSVSVGDGLPTVESAKVPLLIAAGQNFGFSALAAGVTGGLTYSWDFDYDGTFSPDSALQNPTFAYTTGGTHTGLLRVYDENGFTPFAFQVNVLNNTSVPVAVPLPIAFWGGLGLVAAIGMVRARSRQLPVT